MDKKHTEFQHDATTGFHSLADQLNVSAFGGVKVFEIQLGNGIKWEVPLRRSLRLKDQETNKHYIVGWNYDIFRD
ncbi:MULTISPECIES: hypothetical protein [Laceyella]|uniref:Uncharacterized protein n=1 Tax=Laceyella sediminis TaxID=573074 RepID=A0ABX5EQ07_9BACL|nr:hypothetical protein [Laceyella sediminis]MRG29287.1 hypothetical protein [Laceyella tengchongensis]PRZ13617.1 hypothetical protein CLV36_108114 [Laceyella sediminis]